MTKRLARNKEQETAMAYQCILFDLDGTLTDPMAGITGCVQYALHKMGIEEPDLNKLKPFIGPPLLDSFHEFYGMDDAVAAFTEVCGNPDNTYQPK